MNECRPKRISIDQTMFPTIGPPATPLEPNYLHGVAFWLLLAKFGCKNIIQNALSQRSILADESSAHTLVNTQTIDANAIHSTQETVHIELCCSRFEQIPIDLVAIRANKYRPIANVAESDLDSREVRRHMFQQKQRIEIGRGQCDVSTFDIDLLALGCDRQPLQFTLNLDIRGVRMNVDKVVVVLHQNPIQLECCVVVFILVDFDTVLFA